MFVFFLLDFMPDYKSMMKFGAGGAGGGDNSSNSSIPGIIL